MCRAADLYVVQSYGGIPSGDEGSATNPITGSDGIATAIPRAASGDTIYVGGGTYYEFSFPALEDPPIELSIIADNWNQYTTGDAIIDGTGRNQSTGVTIAGGQTEESLFSGFIVQNWDPPGSGGCGIRIGPTPNNADGIGCSPRVEDCIIRNNTSDGLSNYGGAGMQIAWSCHPAVSGCVFEEIAMVGSSTGYGGTEEQFIPCPVAGSVGFSRVAVSGDLLAVGAPDHGVGCVTCSNGAVFIYRFNGASYAQEAMFAPLPFQASTFGETVAMSGPVLAVGGYDHDVDPAPLSADLGSVHVYRDTAPGGLALEQVLSSDLSVSYGFEFGWSVAIDGDVIAVGDPAVGAVVPSAGVVYVFRFDGSAWNQEAVLGGVLPDRRFGYAVAVRGSLLAVGAPKTNGWLGAVHIYRYIGSQWVEQQVIVGDIPNTGFGRQLAVEEDVVLAGQSGLSIVPGKVRVYRDQGGTWTETEHFIGSETVLGSAFGSAIACSGNTVLIGEPELDNGPGLGAGAAWHFALDPEEFRRGDANGDGGIDIGDVIAALGALFIPGAPPTACLDAADANDDGAHNVADAIYALGALFLPGSPPLPAPHPGCGEDPTADGLPCGSFAACP